MKRFQKRTARLLGEAAVEKLQNSFVALIGLGGVGGHCAEALARAGIGHLFILDGDVVEESNLNRQLVATKSTLGMAKTEAMRLRLQEVSDCRITAQNIFLTPENISEVLPQGLDFLIDAIDMVPSKIALAEYAVQRDIPIISCMGAGNRLDPSAFYVTDLFSTSHCPLARVMRQGLRKKGIHELTVVASRELARPAPEPDAEGKRSPGSLSCVPAAAGLVLAGHVIRTLSGIVE